MYSYAQSAKDITQIVLDNLPAGITQNAVKMPSAKFKTPNGKFLRLSFTTLSSENIGPCWKRDLVLMAVDFMYPSGKGQFSQIQDAENMRDILENKVHSNAIAEKALINPLGEDNQYSIVQLQQQFYFEGEI
tara:strand:- start:599 stop:994 length:396 start_codon:yes stop_codon:yes gene_type:complete